MIFCEVSTGQPRPYIPAAFRREILERYHRTSHPGIQSSFKLISKKFFSPNLGRVVTKRFDELHLDIIRPLPTASGYRYCITIVDHFTRWPEALPVMDIRAETVATAIYHGWVSKFGSPSYIVTDKGTQFESELFYELSKLFGFKRKCITAYHPQAKGLVESTLKAAIMCHSDATWYLSTHHPPWIAYYN
ncbi:uncharacterized protein TNCV_4781251 [Trichonephila clavipes]|nr:uncharacterized protein TNCV_4781251 [Trichonephila clavipes]